MIHTKNYFLFIILILMSLCTLNAQTIQINSSKEKINTKTVQSDLILNEEELNYIKEKKKIIIANEYDWIPYDFNEEGIPKGYVIDYIKKASKIIGLEAVFITDKWSNLVSRFKNKEIDILPVISYSKKREDFLQYSNTYLNQTLTIVTKKSINDIVNLDDLSTKKVGMIKGWNSTNILRKNYPNMNIIEFESLNDVFDAIKNNFIDATIQNKFIANYYINKEFRDDLKANVKVTVPSHDSELYIGLQKNDDILTNLFNKAIFLINAEESTKALEDKWISYGKEIRFSKNELDFIENSVINILGTTNWAPFNFVADDEFKGLSIDFFDYIKDKSNLKTTTTYIESFANALDLIEKKEKDIILAATLTKDRERYSIFSDSFLTTPIGIATLQDKNYIPSAKELLGRKVVVVKNSSANKLLEERYPSMDFTFVDNVHDALEYLSQDKVYAYIDIMPVLTYNIEKFGYTNLKVSGQTGIDFNLKFMIRDDYPALQSIINKTLRNMPLEEKNKIIDKWLKVKFEATVDHSLVWKTVAIFLIILIFVLYKNKQLHEYQKKLEKTKKELEDSLSNFKTLMNLNIAGVMILKNRKITYLNDETLNIFGYDTKEQLINKSFENLIINNSNDDSIFKLIEYLEESYEFLGRKKDENTFPILLKVKKIFFDNSTSYIISIVDLTELKNKEEIMIQQSKMASLGEMIGNIAHQWRQPLSSISTMASGLKLQKEFDQLEEKVLLDSLDKITDTTKFLSQTIDDFQNYIKENKIERTFDVQKSIEKVLTILNGSFVNNFITVEKDLQKIEINSFENELNQVLLNVLSNSKDALSNIPDDRKINIKLYKDQKSAIIEVIDNGGGVDKKIIDKVFDPYFTTKHKSQGTGLGLYMTHKIMKESINGSISIKNCKDNESEKCTKVTLTIPIKN